MRACVISSAITTTSSNKTHGRDTLGTKFNINCQESISDSTYRLIEAKVQ